MTTPVGMPEERAPIPAPGVKPPPTPAPVAPRSGRPPGMRLEAVLQPYVNQINEEIQTFLKPRLKPEVLYEAVRHLPLAGGKRLRPVCSILAAQAVGGEMNDVLPFGLSLELLHSFSLVHDDIMDNDDLRRNVPTVHVKFGQSNAILAGDTLFALSIEALTKLSVDPRLLKSLFEDFAKLSVEICEGQFYDIDFEKQKKVGEMDYYHMIERKTATMFEIAMKGGGVIAGADPSLVKKLAEAGRLIGLAFQVWDDYLDIMGVEAELGKRVGSDILNGKKTLVIVKALETLDPFDRRKLYDLITLKEKTPENLDQVMGYLKKSRAIDYTRDRAKQFSSHAKAALASLPESNAKSLLVEIADYVVNRQK